MKILGFKIKHRVLAKTMIIIFAVIMILGLLMTAVLPALTIL